MNKRINIKQFKGKNCALCAQEMAEPKPFKGGRYVCLTCWAHQHESSDESSDESVLSIGFLVHTVAEEDGQQDTVVNHDDAKMIATNDNDDEDHDDAVVNHDDAIVITNDDDHDDHMSVVTLSSRGCQPTSPPAIYTVSRKTDQAARRIELQAYPVPTDLSAKGNLSDDVVGLFLNTVTVRIQLIKCNQKH